MLFAKLREKREARKFAASQLPKVSKRDRLKEQARVSKSNVKKIYQKKPVTRKGSSAAYKRVRKSLLKTAKSKRKKKSGGLPWDVP